MIKLLKYDWKRNSTLILSTIAVLVVIQITLTIVGETNNWIDGLTFALSILGYFSAAMILFINCLRTYDLNIKSFSRRLLPLHPLLGTFAVVVLSWLVVTAVAAIAAIHGLIYLTYKGIDIGEIIRSFPFHAGTLILWAAHHISMHISFVIIILASITVARSFRRKRTAWIGIVFFFAVMGIMLWLEQLLFKNSAITEGNVSTAIVNINDAGITINSSFIPKFTIGPFLLEMVFTAGSLVLITYLLNKKAEL